MKDSTWTTIGMCGALALLVALALGHERTRITALESAVQLAHPENPIAPPAFRPCFHCKGTGRVPDAWVGPSSPISNWVPTSSTEVK